MEWKWVGIQKIENKDRFILLITKEDVKPENESSKETDIHRYPVK